MSRQKSGVILKKKVEILSYYSDGAMVCAHCGFGDIRALSIDHIDGGGAPHRRKTGNDVYGWLKRNNFPEGYQVLCMNCQHGKRMNKGMCPHQESRVTTIPKGSTLKWAEAQ